jgi:arylsulfatase A-like enzyme
MPVARCSLRFRLLLVVAACAASSLDNSVEAAARKPNVVVFLIDDLGWSDLSCMGSKLYETPHLDRMASQGMKFTHAYSACTVCSPTRAALLTGKYPARLHITDWIAGHQRPFAKLAIPDWTKYLPLEEVTLAELLKAQGYATASVGKWHLGGVGYEPTLQGFDENIGGNEKGSPPGYFGPFKLPTLEAKPGESLTELLTERAVDFIDRHQAEPFFVYFPHYTVHTPLQAKPEVVEKYRKKLEQMKVTEFDDTARPREFGKQHPQQHPIYAAMIESMDDSVGAVLKKLDELKLADDTIVIFTGDNGGLMLATDNSPARVGKGSAYEGGVRVPLLVRYPKHIAAGGESDAAVMTIDFLPTILDLCGLPAAKHAVDGQSFAKLLTKNEPLARTELYWHYPHYHPGGATPYGAIRDGDWRLVEFYEDDHVELYYLRDDVGEKKDLAKQDPSRADALRKKLHDWRAAVGAQMPTPNPKYDADIDSGKKADPNKKPGKPKKKSGK